MSATRNRDDGPERAQDTAGDRTGGRLSELRTVLTRYPDFRRLYLARYASLLGDWFNLLAILALVRAIGADDARAISVLLILKLLPAAIVGPLAGVVADRLPRRTIMIVADGARFLFVLLLFAAPALSPARGLVLVYVLTALQIAGQGFAEPARLASIPNVVPGRLLGAANALGALTWSLMFTLGAGVGGLVTSLLGWQVALVIDAATYVVSMLLVARVRLPAPPDHGDAASGTWSGVADLARFGAFLKQRPRIATTLLAKSGWGLAGGITLMLTLYGERIYAVAGQPTLGISVLYMARGLGTAIGPLLARRLTREQPAALPRAISVSFFSAAACYAGFGMARSLSAAVVLIVLAHLGGSTVWVFSTLMLQRSVPDRFRGRVFSLDMALATLSISAATWVSGELVDRQLIDLRTLPLFVALALVVSGTVWVVAGVAVRRRARGCERSPGER